MGSFVNSVWFEGAAGKMTFVLNNSICIEVSGLISVGIFIL